MSENEVTKVMPANENLPAHLRADVEAGAPTGTEELSKYVRPPMLKIVQKQSDDELLKVYSIGDTIAMPDNAMIAPRGEVFKFVPLFFYTEAIQWASITARGKVPPILQRTTNKADELYKKAQNKATWTEKIVHPDAGEIDVRNCEHLNFIITLLDHPLQGIPMIMSYSRGEFGNGIKVSSLIKGRRAPIFGCVFDAVIDPDVTRSNNFGSWCGWDVRNPDDEASRWVSDVQTYEQFKAIHTELAESYASNLIVAEYEADAPTHGEVEDRDDM